MITKYWIRIEKNNETRIGASDFKDLFHRQYSAAGFNIDSKQMVINAAHKIRRPSGAGIDPC